jgi:hypothetical protein
MQQLWLYVGVVGTSMLFITVVSFGKSSTVKPLFNELLRD